MILRAVRHVVYACRSQGVVQWLRAIEPRMAAWLRAIEPFPRQAQQRALGRRSRIEREGEEVMMYYSKIDELLQQGSKSNRDHNAL